MLDGLLLGFDDDTVISVGELGHKRPTLALLREPVESLPDERAGAAEPREVWYAERLDQLRRVDRILAADGQLRARAMELLDLPPASVLDIGLPHEQAEPSALDAMAERIIDAVVQEPRADQAVVTHTTDRRPRLAFVSPLPPVQSGISDYSAELLPELARHYRIDLILDQPEAGGPWTQAQGRTHNVDWLRANAERFDRVVYQVGNALYHRHMLPLMEEVPGVVVLHDLFLTHLLAHLELTGEAPGVWSRALFDSHGYGALRERFSDDDVHRVIGRYPCNRQVLRNARHLMVHSESAKRELLNWYPGHRPTPLSVVPMPRVKPAPEDRAAALRALGLPQHAFVVCSFGRIGETKLSRRIFAAWLDSALGADDNCMLVFVGSAPGDYGQALTQASAECWAKDRVRITGWVDQTAFRQYLAVTDIAVQVRSRSLGETSAAALDCLNYGVATIVNAIGAMAELPDEAVWRLPETFTDRQLSQALETLRREPEQARALGEQARRLIQTRHTPRVCAERYAQVIEDCYAGADVVEDRLLSALAEIDGFDLPGAEGIALASAVSRSVPRPCAPRQWLLDVSATCRSSLHSGIERVARALLLALIEHPPAGVRVEPVYLSQKDGGWQLNYARRFTCELLGCPSDLLEDALVEPGSDDLLINLDLHSDMVTAASDAGLYRRLRNRGVAIYATVFDLLPVALPQYFPPGTDHRHARWLKAISGLDGAICISKSVAEAYRQWCVEQPLPSRPDLLRIGWFHLGADLDRAAATRGLPEDAQAQLERLSSRPTFLMVNTIEPRKGHLQTLAAFDALWRAGVDVGLVIVGQEGWRAIPERERRTIPETVRKLRGHPETGRRLLWLDQVSDEYLEQLYNTAACLINASEGEGFGLPLIEAAQRGLPIIARDIPVFREVTGSGARFFNGTEPASLVEAVRAWLDDDTNTRAAPGAALRVGTWAESAGIVVDMLKDERHPHWLDPAAAV